MISKANDNRASSAPPPSLADAWETMVSSRLPTFEQRAAAARCSREHWTNYLRALFLGGRVRGIQEEMRRCDPALLTRVQPHIDVAIERLEVLATRAAGQVLAAKRADVPLWAMLLEQGRIAEIEAAARGQQVPPAPIFPGQPPLVGKPHR